MAKIEFNYSKGGVNRAGLALISDDKSAHGDAKAVLDNWRACHVAPLNSFQTSLRGQLSRIDSKALVSQRLKRTPSILSKLERNPKMHLARMQDIGGIRAIAQDMQKVRQIESVYKKGTRVFSIVNGGKDYINYPKESGYRSVHMVFKCKNGFSIELQIRTVIQHAWATAVETMGTFLDHSLKSSEGPEEWLNFFSLASSAFSILESTPRVPDHDKYSAYEVFDMLLKKEQELDVLNKLSGFRVVARHIENDNKKGHYHLIILNLDTKRASIRTYTKKDVDTANIEYSKFEALVSEGADLQVVLVTSESIAALRKAYPSYFLDAEMFAKQIASVKKAIQKIK
jgi:Uncharacterized protein conserved in bacteria